MVWFEYISLLKTISVKQQSNLDGEQFKICNDNLRHGVHCVTYWLSIAWYVFSTAPLIFNLFKNFKHVNCEKSGIIISFPVIYFSRNTNYIFLERMHECRKLEGKRKSLGISGSVLAEFNHSTRNWKIVWVIQYHNVRENP